MNRLFSFMFLLIPVTWAGSFIAGKYVIRDVDPVGSVFLRFFLSALIMLPGLYALHRKKHPSFSDRQFLKHLLIVVLTAGIGYHVFFFWALEYTSPTNTALIIALNPFFTAFAEIVIFRRRRPGRFYLGFILAFAGALWVNISRGGQIDLSALGRGELFCLIASLLWSLYTISAKVTKKKEWDSLWINAYNYLFTAVFLLPLWLVILKPGAWPAPGQAAWLGIFYMALFPTVIGYTLFYVGVQRRGPAWAATFIYLVPSLTAILDYLFFRSHFTSAMAWGTTFVVSGLLIGNLPAHLSARIFRIRRATDNS